MDPVLVGSARRHGIQDDDMLHAYRHPIRVFDVDDLDMLIGADNAGQFSRLASQPLRMSSSSFMPWPAARPKFLET